LMLILNVIEVLIFHFNKNSFSVDCLGIFIV
jgi:hypothetical protein